MWRIGLTGGIGSGKSTVARLLVQHGAELIDSDAIARQLTQAAGAALPELVAAFGSAVIAPDGTLNRTKMRQLVFSDPEAKHTLERILHPLIHARAYQQAAAATAKVLVFDVPLLVEAPHWRERVDQVWVVDCLERTQIARVLQRPGWTENAIRAVLTQQVTRAQRRACADVVVFNDELALEALADEVGSLWAGLPMHATTSTDTNNTRTAA